MTLKQLLLIAGIATAICWLAWIIVLFQVSPQEAQWLDFSLFYISLFFALAGTFFLANFAWRKVFSRLALDYKIVSTSFRQSIFFALMIIGILALQSQSLLTWWNTLIILVAVTLLEGFLLSLRRRS